MKGIQLNPLHITYPPNYKKVKFFALKIRNNQKVLVFYANYTT